MPAVLHRRRPVHPARHAICAAVAFVPVLSAATARAAPPSAATPGPAPAVPRFSGWHLRADLDAGLGFARVRELSTPHPLLGPAGSLAVGQVVLPWLALGLRVWGQIGYANPGARQRLAQGAVLLDGTFRPIPKAQLLLRASVGVGGGAVREDGRSGRSGFGGPVFGLDLGYAFFPGVRRYRPYREGGFFVGPHVGYTVATPAARGRPMAHTISVGIATGFFFGE
ncbi:MAG: hypothetical protein D6705_03290 [Deltaproteobacteria bacterium]|nr:MAG: hypothetical protein D6705_03290 [Deltaproteobacteria bacterium]